MASIFDLQRDDPKKVIDQILHKVHSAIDVHFADAAKASPRFSDTVFDAPEQTKILAIPEMETTITDTKPMPNETQTIRDFTKQSSMEDSPNSRIIITVLLIILAAILIFIGLSL